MNNILSFQYRNYSLLFILILFTNFLYSDTILINYSNNMYYSVSVKYTGQDFPDRISNFILDSSYEELQSYNRDDLFRYLVVKSILLNKKEDFELSYSYFNNFSTYDVDYDLLIEGIFIYYESILLAGDNILLGYSLVDNFNRILPIYPQIVFYPSNFYTSILSDMDYSLRDFISKSDYNSTRFLSLLSNLDRIVLEEKNRILRSVRSEIFRGLVSSSEDDLEKFSLRFSQWLSLPEEKFYYGGGIEKGYAVITFLGIYIEPDRKFQYIGYKRPRRKPNFSTYREFDGKSWDILSYMSPQSQSQIRYYRYFPSERRTLEKIYTDVIYP